jgi:AraC family transcriptional regulator
MSEMSSNLLGPFDLLASVDVAGMRTDVRRYSGIACADRVWTAPNDVLSFQYNSGVKIWGRQVSENLSPYVAEGPLTFRPRFASWQSKTNGSPQVIVKATFETPLTEIAGFYAEFGRIEDYSMMEMMRLLHDELLNPGFASIAMIESISELLKIQIFRLAGRSNGSDKASRLSQLELDRIHEYIADRRGIPPSVEELARQLNMSRRSLLRRFKSTKSITVARYIAGEQIARAKRLLATSDLILKQVAYETGFKNPSNFTTAFRRATGLTPTAFRSQARGGRRAGTETVQKGRV